MFLQNKKFLGVVDIPGERLETLCTRIESALNQHELNDKVIALSSDNTNANFGGVGTKDEYNVHKRMQRMLVREIFPLGCAAHIVHNTSQSAMSTLPLDVECMIIKVFGNFHVNTCRVEKLKGDCDMANVVFRSILSHSKLKWRSMLPAVERILRLYDPLKCLFFGEPKCPRFLRDVLENPKSEMGLLLVHSVKSIFQTTILALEGQDKTVVASAKILGDLLLKLTAIRDEHFTCCT